MEIVVGTKKWSSWSMRPWLALKHTGQPFDETLIRIHWEGAAEEILQHSPSGLVPALKHDGLVINDSLAVCEYLHEQYPAARLWPADPAARALGRAAAAEMHAGFHSLRGECPMDLTLSTTADLTPATGHDIRRILALWTALFDRFGGPWLLGPDWSIADAFYTPVATRFRSYGVKLTDYGDAGRGGAYCERLLAAPEFRAWEADALKDFAVEG